MIVASTKDIRPVEEVRAKNVDLILRGVIILRIFVQRGVNFRVITIASVAKNVVNKLTIYEDINLIVSLICVISTWFGKSK